MRYWLCCNCPGNSHRCFRHPCRGRALLLPHCAPGRSVIASPSQVLAYSAWALRESGELTGQIKNTQLLLGETLRYPLPGVQLRLHCAHRAPPELNLAKYLRARLRPPGRVGGVREKKEKPPLLWGLFFLGSGNDLLSRAVSSQVPSALKGLTSVFGMGTGGTLSPLSPEFSQVRFVP